MLNQAPSTVLMIRPASFGFNNQTKDSNDFQTDIHPHDSGKINTKAVKEFDRMVRELREAGVKVIAVNDPPLPVKPDSIFPNNWISFHHDGTVVLYPMLAENRRIERRSDILNLLQKRHRFDIRKIIDLSGFENERKFLEGTGSIVFDYRHKLAYSALSPRTDESVLKTICSETGFQYRIFKAFDRSGRLIYHTNVIMCIGSKFVIICLESVKDEAEREMLVKSLTKTGHKIIDITMDQMYSFAGNMIELKGRAKKNLLVMSGSAYKSLTENQLHGLVKYINPVVVDIPTIEQIGGGSARCMMAGVYLPLLEA